MLFYGVCYVYFLLYKLLPSKVTLLSSIVSVYFIGFQIFSEGKLYLSTSLISSTALHIETISLVNGTYEFIQEPDEDTSEVQVNIMEDNEDLNVNPKFNSELHEVQTNIAELTEVPNPDSEELKFTDSIDSSKGKPWCIILLF